MNVKESSPFTPGSPVPLELFVGRSRQIEEVNRYIRQAATGKQENIFLAGDRGIGKSSLASFLRHLVSTQGDVLGIHVSLGRSVSTLEEMVRHIFDQILKETRSQSWFKSIAQYFGKHIQEVGLFGISVSFAPPEKDLKELARNFPEALKNLLEKIQPDKKALFIALDDINGLAGKVEFANWYKSFADGIATHYENFPVSIMLVGLPENRDTLSNLQPSLMRIFRVVEIEKLSDNEVSNFLLNAFEKAEIEVKTDALDVMVRFSSGLPALMQEIGDAIFWLDSDGIIDEDDALAGIVEAAEKVGRKYLDPKIYRAIRSKQYRSILRKFGQIYLSRKFAKKEVEENLDESEKKVFHNFLRKLRELGIIEPDLEQGRGTYRFVNEIYPVYLRMESERFRKSA